MKSCLVIGYMNANFGDDLFFKILFERYKKVKFYFFPPSELLKQYKRTFRHNRNVIFYDQDEFYLRSKEEVGDDSVPIYLFPMILEKAKEADFYINIGGSIFIQNPDWKEDDRFKIKEALGKKPSFIVGCNFGPGDKEYHDYFEKWFKNFDDVCFRDKKSYKQFNNLNNTRIADDIVLVGANKNKKSPMNKKTIGISVIDVENYPEIAKSKEIYLKFITNIIKIYKKKDYKISLFSFCKKDGDLKAIYEILERIDDNKNIKVVSYEGNINRVISEWKSNKYIIATRFHAVILALKYKQIFLPLVYSNKTSDYLKDIDRSIRTVDINSLKNININKLTFVEINKKYNSEEQFEKIDKYLKGE